MDAVADDDVEDKVDAKMELDALFSGLKAKKKKAQADTAAEQKRLDDERAEKLAYRKKLEKIENECTLQSSLVARTHANMWTRRQDEAQRQLQPPARYACHRLSCASRKRIASIVRYDADGLPIYTAASLRINQGGDTADCPFDCWCCF